MISEYLLKKLHSHYSKHESIIIAVDFDDTIAPSCEESVEQCKRAVSILQYAQQCINCKTVIYTARCSDIPNFEWISKFCDTHNIHVDDINGNIINWYPSPSKIYYNILLDDKSGLNECLDTLEKFVNEIIEK